VEISFNKYYRGGILSGKFLGGLVYEPFQGRPSNQEPERRYVEALQIAWSVFSKIPFSRKYKMEYVTPGQLTWNSSLRAFQDAG
jgi:hypothetical protein